MKWHGQQKNSHLDDRQNVFCTPSYNGRRIFCPLGHSRLRRGRRNIYRRFIKSMKKIFLCAMALLLALALLLTACGKGAGVENTQKPETSSPGTKETQEPEASSPSQSPQPRYAYGTISEEEELKILYTLNEDHSLEFFRDGDTSESILRLDLSSYEDPEYSLNGLSFKDVDGDDYNDLCLPLSDAGTLFWLWNGEAGADKFADEPLAPGKLYLTVENWPAEAVYQFGDENEQGDVHHTWQITDGPMLILVRTLPAEANDLNAMAEKIADWLGEDASDIQLQEDPDVSAKLSYPAYRVQYESEGNKLQGVYLQADNSDFCVLAASTEDTDAAYAETIQGWLDPLVLQEVPGQL